MAEKAKEKTKVQKDQAAVQRRKARLERLAAANKITVILERDVRKFMTAQARAAGMDIAPFLQKVVENHVMEHTPDGDPLGERLRAKRAVLDYAVDLARKMDADGAFDEHFILKVMKTAAADKKFAALYNTAIGAQAGNEKRAARAKVPLNQQLGRLIKRAAEARSKRDAKGKIMRAQAQGEILTTYTLLDKAA